MKKIYSLVMALCVALCASATPFQGLVKQDLKLHHSVAEFATGIQKAPAATQGLQYDAEAGSLTRYYNETDKLDVITEYVAEYGELYVDVMAADKSDCLSLLLFVKSAEGGKVPAGTYPINNTGAEGTAYASEGYNMQYGVIPCAYYPLVLQNGELYISTPMYFMVSGNIVVEYVNNNLKLTIDAVNSNNVPVHIVYEVGGESKKDVKAPLKYDMTEGSVNRTYGKDDIVDLKTDYVAQYGELYLDITAADGSDKVTVAFSVKAVDPVTVLPAGTYPITDTGAVGTVFASPGVIDGAIYPSFYGTLHPQGGLNVPCYFMVGGNVVVENLNGALKVTIDALNSNDIPAHIVYNAAGTNTAVDNVAVENNVSKVLENGQIFIMKDGVKYNAIGSVVK